MIFTSKPEGTRETRIVARITPMFGKKGRWKRNKVPMADYWHDTVMWVKSPNTGLVIPLRLMIRLDTIGEHCLN